MIGTILGCWDSELEGKKVSISLLYFPKVSKLNNLNFFAFATGVNDTSSKPWAANISAKFSKKFETALMLYSGAWRKQIHEKTRSGKSRDTVPLITFQVTLTGQSHFMLTFVLRKVTLRGHINSVPRMYAVTPTPSQECTQFVDSVKSL